MNNSGPIRGITGNGRYIVVSADTHGGAALTDYREYLPASLHDDFDAWASVKLAEGHDTNPNNYDLDQRRTEQVADGVVAGVIFPNTDPPFSLNVFERGHDRRSVELQWEGLKAHNRWVADHCANEPDRLRGVLQTSPFLPEESAAEIRAAAENPLMSGGVLVRISPPDGAFPQLYEEHWEPVWAAAADVGLPITTHGGNEPLYGPGPGRAAIQLVEVGWWTRRGLTQFLLGGILDRHRGLTLVLTEQAVGWIRTDLPQISWFATQVRLKHDAAGADHLERTPRQAFLDQVIFGASFPSRGRGSRPWATTMSTTSCGETTTRTARAAGPTPPRRCGSRSPGAIPPTWPGWCPPTPPTSSASISMRWRRWPRKPALRSTKSPAPSTPRTIRPTATLRRSP